MRLLIAILAIASQSGFAAAKTDSEQRIAHRRFAKCPGAQELKNAANVSWQAQASKLTDHIKLRERLKAPMPEGSHRILFWSSGMHHTRVQFSVIATRNTNGTWQTNGVGEESSALLPMEPKIWPELNRNLSFEASRALDRLLADPCLYASPRFQRAPNIIAGGAIQTIEIETPERRLVASWWGVRTPQQEALVNMITQ